MIDVQKPLLDQTWRRSSKFGLIVSDFRVTCKFCVSLRFSVYIIHSEAVLKMVPVMVRDLAIHSQYTQTSSTFLL